MHNFPFTDKLECNFVCFQNVTYACKQGAGFLDLNHGKIIKNDFIFYCVIQISIIYFQKGYFASIIAINLKLCNSI